MTQGQADGCEGGWYGEHNLLNLDYVYSEIHHPSHLVQSSGSLQLPHDFEISCGRGVVRGPGEARGACSPPPDPPCMQLESRLRRVVPTVQSLPARPPGDTNRGPGLGHPPALSGGRIARKRRRRHGPAVRDRSALPRLRSAMARFSA